MFIRIANNVGHSMYCFRDTRWYPPNLSVKTESDRTERSGVEWRRVMVNDSPWYILFWCWSTLVSTSPWTGPDWCTLLYSLIAQGGGKIASKALCTHGPLRNHSDDWEFPIAKDEYDIKRSMCWCRSRCSFQPKGTQVPISGGTDLPA